jgi:homogentisate 1,2-dioxygenase
MIQSGLRYASFDVVGWDGYIIHGFSIHNFEPITGRVHQPPTSNIRNFDICSSFVPRLYDYHQNLFQLHTIAIMIGDEVLLLCRW